MKNSSVKRSLPSPSCGSALQRPRPKLPGITAEQHPKLFLLGRVQFLIEALGRPQFETSEAHLRCGVLGQGGENALSPQQARVRVLGNRLVESRISSELSSANDE